MQIDHPETTLTHEEMKGCSTIGNGHARPSLIPPSAIRILEHEWHSNPRWQGVTRGYTEKKCFACAAR